MFLYYILVSFYIVQNNQSTENCLMEMFQKIIPLVIERPESVNLVKPPTMIMKATKKNIIINHNDTLFRKGLFSYTYIDKYNIISKFKFIKCRL